MATTDQDEPRLLAYRIGDAEPLALRAAPKKRPWIDATAERFARRCLPLLIANEAGWFIENAHTVHATWSGDDDPNGLAVEYEDTPGEFACRSHFGHGILTWNLPYLFRTPKGWNLLVRGPSNLPKDGASPLEGLVEADWAVATFTMNWKLTRIAHRVTFGAGEPICMIVPQRRGDLDRLIPVVTDLDSQSDVAREYHEWRRSREAFLAQLRMPWSEAMKIGWQRDYFRGRSPGTARAHEHQLGLRLRDFEDDNHTRGRQQVLQPHGAEVESQRRRVETCLDSEDTPT